MRVRRALVCAPRVPEFDRESGSQRIFSCIEYLRRDGWAVSFVARDATGGEQYLRRLQQMGVTTYAGEESFLAGDGYLPDPAALVAHGRFDLAILHFWYIAEYYLPLFRTLSPQTRLIVDSIDLHFLRVARGTLGTRANGTPPRLTMAQADEMMRELNTYVAADMVLTVSLKEADLLNDLTGIPGLAQVVPDGESIEPSAVPLEQRKGLLFLGNFRHPPNVGAVQYLCEEIVPLLDPALLTRHPLYIVGNNLDTRIAAYGRGHPAIRMVGWVPSVLPYLYQARVALVPLLYGAGTKRKLLQALMAGTPSVSTRIGAEGFELQHGEHLLIADDAESFARAIQTLLHDDQLWRQLAGQGQAAIQATHSSTVAASRLRAAIAKAGA